MKYGLYFTKGFVTLIDELLEEYYKVFNKEDFLHLFYLLEKSKETNGAVELPSGIREQFGRKNGQWKFASLIRICEELDIIFSTSYSNYENNNYCKSYGYTSNFISKLMNKELEFQFCEISEKTYNLIVKHYELPTDPILLEHYHTIEKLTIDLEKAEEFAKQFSGEKFLRVVRDISTIYNKEHIIVTRDERTGRVFTSFNMMKKELRELCSYDGEKLISLDLKSSQPYLLASILLQENPDNPQVQEFYNLVTESDLYDWLIEQWDISEYIPTSEVRNSVKKLFFNYLYKKNQGTNSAQMLFQDKFPVIYELIKDKKRKEELWLTLQKLEASIFVEVANEYVSQGCLSVHDSLYFPESMREVVESSLRTRFLYFNLTRYDLK